MKRTIRRLLLISLLVVWMPGLASAQQPRMISIGERRVAVYCEGQATRSPMVILIPAPGRTAKDWEKVLPAVAKFARVAVMTMPILAPATRRLLTPNQWRKPLTICRRG
jgi:hypothetical protein